MIPERYAISQLKPYYIAIYGDIMSVSSVSLAGHKMAWINNYKKINQLCNIMIIKTVGCRKHQLLRNIPKKDASYGSLIQKLLVTFFYVKGDQNLLFIAMKHAWKAVKATRTILLMEFSLAPGTQKHRWFRSYKLFYPPFTFYFCLCFHWSCLKYCKTFWPDNIGINCHIHSVFRGSNQVFKANFKRRINQLYLTLAENNNHARKDCNGITKEKRRFISANQRCRRW